jgi:hypothetical protein
MRDADFRITQATTLIQLLDDLSRTAADFRSRLEAELAGTQRSGQLAHRHPTTSPYLTADEAAAYLRFPTTHALRVAVRKFGIPHIRRGRKLFFTEKELNEFMDVASEATNPRRPSRRRRGKGQHQ